MFVYLESSLPYKPLITPTNSNLQSVACDSLLWPVILSVPPTTTCAFHIPSRFAISILCHMNHVFKMNDIHLLEKTIVKENWSMDSSTKQGQKTTGKLLWKDIWGSYVLLFRYSSRKFICILYMRYLNTRILHRWLQSNHMFHLPNH
jgi:hypothetical protein